MSNIDNTHGLVPSPAPDHAFGLVVDDWEAIEIWLSAIRSKSKKQISQTEVTYRFHLEKLRWYCENYIGLTPSRWSAKDVSEFVNFLENLPDNLVSKRGIDHNDPAWTPFKSKPSENSRSDILRFVHAMFQTWHKMGYIRINPMALHGTQAARRVNASRSVPINLLEVVLAVMESPIGLTYSQRQRLARDRFILLALRDLGLRASELVEAKMSAFYQLTIDDETYWIFKVTEESAKGSVERKIPVTQTLWDAFTNYRAAFGLNDEPMQSEAGALILSSKTTEIEEGNIRVKTLKSKRFFKSWVEVTTRQGLYKIVKKRLAEAGNYLKKVQRFDEAESLKAVSPHWLRHTFGKAALLSGQSMREVAAALGHKSLETTMIYTEQDARDLVEAWKRVNPGSLAVIKNVDLSDEP